MAVTGSVVPLTEKQKVFAEEHHNMIYGFLRQRCLAIDDWYDIVAFAYLDAVNRVFSDTAIDDPEKYIYSAMSLAVKSEFRRQYCLKRKGDKRLLSLETLVDGDEEKSDRIKSALASPINDFSDMELRIDLERCIFPSLTYRQQAILCMAVSGNGKMEILNDLNHYPKGSINGVRLLDDFRKIKAMLRRYFEGCEYQIDDAVLNWQNNFFCFHDSVAQQIGVNRAILVHALFCLIRDTPAQDCQKFEGKLWAKIKFVRILRRLPFWKKGVVSSYLQSLTHEGIIYKAQFGKHLTDGKQDFTTWYALSKSILEVYEQDKGDNDNAICF